MAKDDHAIFLRNKFDEYQQRFGAWDVPGPGFFEFYEEVPDESLRGIFAMFHTQLNSLFKGLNSRIGGHYWADSSRALLYLSEEIRNLHRALRATERTFELIPYYQEILARCDGFLQSSDGSTVPADMVKIDVVEYEPVFLLVSSISVERGRGSVRYAVRQIGSGSYASVYSYYDEHYNRKFAVKRAHANLTADELVRFRTEYETMRRLSSPYVIEVYRFEESRNEYVMEYADATLDEYIAKNNNRLRRQERAGLVGQVLRAFEYIHGKGVLHRDVSTRNIMIRTYDALAVAKVSDFGLVKLPDSSLTKADTVFKGHMNDPRLAIEGFAQYNILHETYSLVWLIHFIMTGRMQLGRFTSPAFKDLVERGMSADLTRRFRDVRELHAAFRGVLKDLLTPSAGAR